MDIYIDENLIESILIIVFASSGLLIAPFYLDYKAKKQMGTLDPKKNFLQNFFTL